MYNLYHDIGKESRTTFLKLGRPFSGLSPRNMDSSFPLSFFPRCPKDVFFEASSPLTACRPLPLTRPAPMSQPTLAPIGTMKAVHLSNGVEKSANDDREYRVVVLENKLVCLLIRDETTDKAAASMDVKVGHFSDPAELPGLAHFCEHMLFLGSKKYPASDYFGSVMSKFSKNLFVDYFFLVVID